MGCVPWQPKSAGTRNNPTNHINQHQNARTCPTEEEIEPSFWSGPLTDMFAPACFWIDLKDYARSFWACEVMFTILFCFAASDFLTKKVF